MLTNRNTYVFGKAFARVPKDNESPRVFSDFRYEPEEGDRVIPWGPERGLPDTSSDGLCTEIYSGVFPRELKSPENGGEYRFVGYKAGGVRTFYLIETE